MSSSITLKHRFEVQDIISQGRYSSVYKCYDKKKERFCIAKMFSNKSIANDHYKREVEVFKKVFPRQVVKGFPKFIANGTHLKGDIEKQKKFIIMSRHGYDLQMIHKICQHRFSPKTALQVSIDLIDKLQKLHQGGYTYEDMKLSNILIALMSEYDQTQLTICDFGNCERLSAWQKSGDASLSPLFKDLERVFFLCIYMIKGELPWRYKQHTDILTQDQKSKVKEGQICNFLKIMDDRFLSIYKFIKQLSEKSIKLADYNFKDYKTLKEMFSQLLEKYKADSDVKFDWYPILARIQKHNRKQGMGQTIQSFRGSSHSGIVSKERKSLRKASCIQSSQHNEYFGNQNDFQKYERISQKSFSPTKHRSKSANILDDGNLYIMKKREKDQELYIEQKVPTVQENFEELEDPKYNFLKLLESSIELPPEKQEKKKDSSKYLFANKVSLMAKQQSEEKFQESFSQNLITLTKSSTKNTGSGFHLFERAKKSTMLLVMNTEKDLLGENKDAHQLEEILENSVSESEQESPYKISSKLLEKRKHKKSSQKQINKYFENQDRDKDIIIPQILKESADLQALKSFNLSSEQIERVSPRLKNLINLKSGFPTFKNVSLNKEMNMSQQNISNKQQSLNELNNMYILGQQAKSNQGFPSQPVCHSNPQNSSSILHLPVGFVSMNGFGAAFGGASNLRKYSGIDASRKFSQAASDISILTIDKYAMNEYDEGVNVNEVKTLENNKVNPLQREHFADFGQERVYQRTFMSFNIKRPLANLENFEL